MATRRTALALMPALAIGLPGVSSAAPRQAAHQRAVPIIRVTAPDGFDWGDAGIGAVGGIGLAMVALGTRPLLRDARTDPREDQ